MIIKIASARENINSIGRDSLRGGNSFPFSVEKATVYTHQSFSEITIILSDFDKIFS